MKNSKSIWVVVLLVVLSVIAGGLFYTSSTKKVSTLPPPSFPEPVAVHPVEPAEPSVSKKPVPMPVPKPVTKPVTKPAPMPPVPKPMVKPSSPRPKPQAMQKPSASMTDSFTAGAAGAAGAAAEAGDTTEIGEVIYNTPENMTLGVTELIEVRISNKDLEETGLAGNGEVVSRSIRITGNMSVKLCCGKPQEDHAFDISSTTPETQRIDDGDYTQWVFRVTPREAGEQTLQLTVTAFLKDKYGEPEFKAKVLTDRINVSVDVIAESLKWLSKHWQWLGLLLLIPLMVFYVMRGLKARNRVVVSGNETIFISYRRSDSSGYTLAIYQSLKEALGPEKVFMDLDDIPHGVDFSEHLEKMLGNATTVLIMIGEGWLNASNDEGRRLDDPDDFVRIEVATALNRDVRVIPVLLKQAQMPNEAELPDALKALSRRNAIRIHDDQFEESIQKLVKSIG